MLSFFSGKQWIICLHASWPDGGNWLILGPTRNEKMQQRPTHRSASPLRVTRKHRCSEGRTAVTPHWKQTHHLSRRRHACHSDRVDFHFQNKKKKNVGEMQNYSNLAATSGQYFNFNNTFFIIFILSGLHYLISFPPSLDTIFSLF